MVAIFPRPVYPSNATAYTLLMYIFCKRAALPQVQQEG